MVSNQSTASRSVCSYLMNYRFLWNIILGETYSNNVIYNVKDGILRRFGKDLTWWLVYIFCLSACLVLDLALISIRAAFWPTDVRILNYFYMTQFHANYWIYNGTRLMSFRRSRNQRKCGNAWKKQPVLSSNKAGTRTKEDLKQKLKLKVKCKNS
jgi:magnesium-transporting ATPase (P-type)